MTTLTSKLCRDVGCACAAVLITFVLSLSLVQSTSAAPFNVTPRAALERA